MLTQDQIDEATALRQNTSTTLRPTVQALEDLLYTPIQVLDHGMLRVVDYLGNDAAVVQSARVSYGAGTKKVSEDEGLLRYMMRHQHLTPFEMCEIKFHVKLPIFIARQWIRHRMGNFNEYSARYSILDNEFYIPEPEHLAAQSNVNRQGRGDVLQGIEAERVLQLLRDDAQRNYDHYTEMLNEGEDADPSRDGLARELARMNLTLNTYTQWYWKVDLRNLLAFIKLRADPHAQFEIRTYADTLFEIVHQWVPKTAKAFYDYEHTAMRLSGMEVTLMKDLIGEYYKGLQCGLKGPFCPLLLDLFTNETPRSETISTVRSRYDLSVREITELRKRLFLTKR